jgi:hypothetical protein
MGFVRIFFKVLFFYFIFIIGFRLIVFLLRYFFLKKGIDNRTKNNSSNKDNYSKKSNIIDAEFEEIE